jgi:transposase-like protein
LSSETFAAVADTRPDAEFNAGVGSAFQRRPGGPDEGWDRQQQKTNYLLRASYRKTSVLELADLGEDGARALMERVRWGHLGENKQVCPKCGTIDSHYWCATPRRWKCRGKLCGHQFTVLQGTRFHGTKMTYRELLIVAFAFVENKDSVSARGLSGLMDRAWHTQYVLTMKFREAISESMKAEGPLTGYIQADAAYFMKYVRPGNVGTGASLAAKKDRKNAGMDENGTVKNTVSPKIHALVVFVQAAQPGNRRYRVAVVKTENQVDLLTLGKQFCDVKAVLTTDGHSGYNLFSGAFEQHIAINHRDVFADLDGNNTNLAEGFFSRMRSAEAGSWHKMTLAHLEAYGWEFAWRQAMVEHNNQEQLEDLLRRMLTAGRATEFRDYWRKSPTAPERPGVSDSRATAVEIEKGSVPARRGRPPKDSVRPQTPELPRRKYTRRSALTPGAGKQPEPPLA